MKTTSLSPFVGLFANHMLQTRARRTEFERDPETGRIVIRPRQERFLLELDDGTTREFNIRAWPISELSRYLESEEEASRKALASVENQLAEPPSMQEAVDRMVADLSPLLLEALSHAADDGPPADLALLQRCSPGVLQQVLVLQDEVNSITEIFESGARLLEQVAVSRATDSVMESDTEKEE